MLTLGYVEEVLIDFREIIGAHSGENMAEIVWETMERYGLIGKVCTYVIQRQLFSEFTIRLWLLLRITQQIMTL